MTELSLGQIVAAFVLPIILGLTLPEIAQAYAARHFGDGTASEHGLLSANPLRRIDAIGTVVLPLLLLVAGKALGLPLFLFGWPKPIPIDYGRLRQPKQDLFWVTAALLGTHIALAVAWTLIAKMSTLIPWPFVAEPLQATAMVGMVLSASLLVISLLPVPPLPGGRILISVLPDKLAYHMARLERYSMWVILALLISGVLGVIIFPAIKLIVGSLRYLSGV